MLLAHGEKAQGYDAASLGNWFRDRCNEAGLPHCPPHGLRKAGARRLAEFGATEWEVMAFLAHKTAKEASRYVAEANRTKLGEVAAYGRGTNLVQPSEEVGRRGHLRC